MHHQVTAALLGGDMRQIAVAEKLYREGVSIRSFGLPREKVQEGILCFESWKEAICGTDCVILPLPASSDGNSVSLPLSPDASIPLFTELFAALPVKTMIAGGKFSPSVKESALRAGRDLFDYFEDKKLQVKNALPTAEGAVCLLMQSLPYTVSGMPVAITGFGRVAKALVKLLLAMGADVTVAARKETDLAMAKNCGCHTEPLHSAEDIRALSKGYKAIFNTVPSLLFDRAFMEIAQNDLLLIDLASAPGGVESTAAAEYGIRVIWALSLPGKYAPYTAGEIIADAILERMREEQIL